MKHPIRLFKKILLSVVVVIFFFPNLHGGGTWGTNYVESVISEIKTYFSLEGKEARKKEQEQERLREEKDKQHWDDFFRKYEKNNNVKCTLNITGGRDCKPLKPVDSETMTYEGKSLKKPD